MKKLIYLLFTISLFHNFTFSQWVQQNSGVSSALYNVNFVNLLTGWVTGSNSVILKTTNGGLNWFTQSIDLVYPKNLYGLDMIDENTGYIAGWFETILKTTNGGVNWNILSNIPSNNGNSNHSCSFVNSQTGWISSSLGRVLRTTNGGVSWDTSFANGTLRDIQFLNNLTGWVCGDGGTLYNSTNGGINWIQFPTLTGSNLDLHFININTGWIVGEQSNYVFKTTDAGSNWDTIAQLPGGSLMYSYTIYFTSPLNGYIGGTFTRLFKSVNGGYDWGRDSLNNLGFINNFSFNNDTIGWAVGGGGLIIHTTNGGAIAGVQQTNSESPDRYNLFQNYPNPFNPVTKIKFDVASVQPSKIKLSIYDMLGREVEILVDEKLKPGSYEIEWNAGIYPSGVYFSCLASENLTLTRKMVLVK